MGHNGRTMSRLGIASALIACLAAWVLWPRPEESPSNSNRSITSAKKSTETTGTPSTRRSPAARPPTRPWRITCVDARTEAALAGVEASTLAGDVLAVTASDGVVSPASWPTTTLLVKPGYVPTSVADPVANGVRRVAIKRGSVVIARVVDIAGKPVAGARLLLASCDDQHFAAVLEGQADHWVGSADERDALSYAAATISGADGSFVAGGLRDGLHYVGIEYGNCVIQEIRSGQRTVMGNGPPRISVHDGATFEIEVGELWYAAALFRIRCPHSGFHETRGGIDGAWVGFGMPRGLKFGRSHGWSRAKEELLAAMNKENLGGVPWVLVGKGPVDVSRDYSGSIGVKCGTNERQEVKVTFRRVRRGALPQYETVDIHTNCPGHGVVEVIGEETYVLDGPSILTYRHKTRLRNKTVFDVPIGEYRVVLPRVPGEKIPASARRRSGRFHVALGDRITVVATGTKVGSRNVVWKGASADGRPSDRFMVELRGGHLVRSVLRPTKGTVAVRLPCGQYRVRVLSQDSGEVLDAREIEVVEALDDQVIAVKCR